MDFDEREFYTEDLSPTHYRSLRLKNVIFDGRSQYQKIRVLDTYDYGRVLVLDDTVQAAEFDEYIYHEILVHPPILFQEKTRSVLVIGGGDGGTIEEVLKHGQLEIVDMVDLDNIVVEVSKKHLQSICGGAFEDPRVNLFIDDGRKYIQGTSKKYDLVILDITDPIGPSKVLYTQEFYNEITRILHPGGVVATHCGGWFDFPKVSSTIYNTFSRAFNHVCIFPSMIPSYGMDLAFLYASQDIDFTSISIENFQRSFHKLFLNIDLRYISKTFIHEMCSNSIVFREYIQSSTRISTDENPWEFQDDYPWETFDT